MSSHPYKKVILPILISKGFNDVDEEQSIAGIYLSSSAAKTSWRTA